MKLRWVILLVTASVLLIMIGVFFVCPPIWFHNHWRNGGLWGTRGRICAVTANKDGKLAVVLKDQGKAFISLMAPSETSCKKVTNGVFDADPAWDSSGNRLAYVSLLSRNQFALHVLDVAKGTDTVILRRSLISQPQWSADGKSILFLDNNCVWFKGYPLYKVDLVDRKPVMIGYAALNRPQSWTLMPDGDTIIYPIRNPSETKSIIVGVSSISKRSTTSSPIQIKNPCMVSASPDGQYLFICENQSIYEKKAYIVYMKTRQSRLVAEGPLRYALWSPSGRYLAVASKSETIVSDTQNRTSAAGTTHKGVVVGWRSPTKMVMIEAMEASHILTETDIASGNTRMVLSL